MRLWSRQGRDLSPAFPDLVNAAAAVIPPGWVVDGEVAIWHQDRLNFSHLQRRLASGPAHVASLAATTPASFLAFDVLAASGRDVRARPWTARRAALNDLAATWVPPLQLSPVTQDLGVATAWFTHYRPAGIEGLVCKGATTTYTPGRRGWWKVKPRATEDVIMGGVIGPITHPQIVVAGRYRGDQLVIVGRTVPLSPTHSRAVAALLRPAAANHPWPAQIGAGHFGAGHDKIALTKVDPQLVVEVSADAALDGGKWRHPLRFLRPRPDLDPAEVPVLD